MINDFCILIMYAMDKQAFLVKQNKKKKKIVKKKMKKNMIIKKQKEI